MRDVIVGRLTNNPLVIVGRLTNNPYNFIWRPTITWVIPKACLPVGRDAIMYRVVNQRLINPEGVILCHSFGVLSLHTFNIR
jgi:hypothetical protein